MNRPSLALVALFWTYASIFAQEPQLALVKLEAAVCSPMAVAAEVYGEVILNVTLASDGSANVVTVEGGPPMLRQAAVDSAKRSQFQANLENGTGGYRLVCRFVLNPTTKCEHDDSLYLPQALQSYENLPNPFWLPAFAEQGQGTTH